MTGHTMREFTFSTPISRMGYARPQLLKPMHKIQKKAHYLLR